MQLAYTHTPESRTNTHGFTIVELLIVVVVIGILAAISLVAYTSIQTNAAESVLKSDLKQASTQLDIAQVQDGGYPSSDDDLPRSGGTNYDYTGGGNSYCLTAWSEAARTSFHISSASGTIADGPCPGHAGYVDAIPANQGIVTTLAGSSFGYADGTGTAARFINPSGITVDTTGNLYIADTQNHRIRKITAGGEVTTLAGSTQGYADGIGTAARFNMPYGVAVDSSGNVYVADTENYRIRKISPSGEVTTFAGHSVLLCDEVEESYCWEGGGYADGTGTAAQFNYPMSIAIDSSDAVYVADAWNNRIRKITPSGVVTTFAGSSYGYADGTGTAARFINPSGITVDTTGNLYIADTGNHRIRKITPSGVVTTLAGSTQGYADGTGTAARFINPRGITVDTTGNLYIADTGNDRIRKITPGGEVSTLAGSTQGYADGTGTAARFWGPYGITVDTTGNLYVADNVNHRIRKIE